MAPFVSIYMGEERTPLSTFFSLPAPFRCHMAKSPCWRGQDGYNPIFFGDGCEGLFSDAVAKTQLIRHVY